MGELLIGVGILLAIVGPLLNLPLIWLIYRLIYRPLFWTRMEARLGRANARWLGVAFATLLLGVVLLFSYLPGRVRFDALCSAEGIPLVHQRVNEAGFYRTRMFAYEAHAYLREGRFRFVEAPDPYRQGELLRYSLLPDGMLKQEKIIELQSRYGVAYQLTSEASGVTVSRKRIFELQGERELARAAQIDYSGGPLWLLFGVYARASCPEVRDPVGSERFRIYYELEQRVLRAAQPLEQGKHRILTYPERHVQVAHCRAAAPWSRNHCREREAATGGGAGMSQERF